VNGNALATRHVANDLFAVQWIAATRARDHQIVNTTHDDRIVSQTNQTFDGAYSTPEPRFLLLVELFKLFWSKILRDHVARHELAVADAREQIVDASVTVITGHAFHVLVVIAEQFPGRELKTRGFFLEEL